MDSGDLRVFLTVAQQGSILKAAQKLNYVQSNVTARVKKLEKELQTVLFYRHHQGVSLTPDGKKLLDYAKPILRLLDEAEKAMRDSSAQQGTIAIGADTTAAIRLPAIIQSFRSRHPEVEIQLQISRTDDIIEALLQYGLDGAFVEGHVQHPDLISMHQIEDELHLYVHGAEPFDQLTDIQEKTVLLFDTDCCYRTNLEQWFRDEGLRPLKAMEFATIEGIITCVKSGVGVTVLPGSFLSRLNLEGMVKHFPLPLPYGKVSTHFLRRRNTYQTAAFVQFQEWVTSGLYE